MRFRPILLFLLILTLPARANLGETVAECVARYGKPVNFSEAGTKSPFGTITFVAAGFGLVVFVYNGKETGAMVSKVDKSTLSDADMQNMMAADTAGGKWTPMASTDPNCLQWWRDDKATVLYDKAKHILIFSSDEMSRVLSAVTVKPAPAPTPPPAK